MPVLRGSVLKSAGRQFSTGTAKDPLTELALRLADTAAKLSQEVAATNVKLADTSAKLSREVAETSAKLSREVAGTSREVADTLPGRNPTSPPSDL